MDKNKEMKKEKNIKSKGRKRDVCWDIFKEADKILSSANMIEWQGIFKKNTSLKHTKLKFAVLRLIIKKSKTAGSLSDILSLLKDGANIPKINSYSNKAVKKMLWEILILLGVYVHFLNELEKAKENNNTYFLDSARYAFEEDAYTLNLDKQGKGRPINKNTFSGHIKKIRDYLTGDKTLEQMGIDKSGNFYTRNKMRYLCRLAYYIFLKLFLFIGQQNPPEYESERAKGIKEIEKLMIKYNIFPWEIPSFQNELRLISKGKSPEMIDHYIKILTA